MEALYGLLGQLLAEPSEFFPWYFVLGDVVDLFYFDLCGKSVAVPSLWKHDIIALHALVAGREVDVAPVEGIADVEIARRVGRGCIDDVLRLL